MLFQTRRVRRRGCLGHANVRHSRRAVCVYVECQAAQYIGCSCALSGNHKRAIEAIQHLDARIPADIAPWVIQAWLFAKADILYLLGDVSEAIVWGRKGVGSDCLTLYSTFFAGAFARWLALSTMGTSREGMAREKLNRMVRDLDSYDAIDQAEVLCARRILHQGGREDLRESSQLIQIKLRALPQAITKQLERLGMLVD